MLDTWNMETTQIGKRNANVKTAKMDFSDIEAAFYCVAINDDYNTVILANSDNNTIIADKVA